MTGSFDCDNMTLGDARELYMHIEKREILNHYTFPEQPGKDGYYRIYVPDDTKKSGRRQLFAKTLTDLEEKVYAYAKGITGSSRKTFHDAYELSLEEKLNYIKDPEKLLSRQNSVSVYRSYYNRFFKDTEFELKFIDEISKTDIEDMIYYNLDRYSLREKALKMMKCILNSAFSLAYEQYWISDNPYDRINMKKFNWMVVKDVDIEKRVHSGDELQRILDEIHVWQRKKPSYVSSYALEMQILIGARRGEIPPLRRSDVHEKYVKISREQITVKKHNGIPEHFEIVEHTKTYKDRCFPRTKDLDEFLERLYAMLDKYYPGNEYLFPSDTPNGVINNNMVYHFYSRLCGRLGIKLSRETVKGTHSFRRNAITDVVNASGGNLMLASQLFGNSPQVVGKNYYTGMDMTDAVEVLNQRKFS